MGTPVLAPNSTWYTQGGTSVNKNTITQIDIKNSYTPTGTVTSSWDASAAKDRSIMCYIEGTKLTIAGNGSGCIYANADSLDVFNGFSSVTVINSANLIDTSNVTTMRRMFGSCKKLKSVDISNWDVSKVTTMRGMFQVCLELTELDLGSWNVGNVTDMRQMFVSTSSYGHMKLTSIGNVGNWNVSKVTDMYGMFQLCSSMVDLDASNWKMSSCIDTSFMFKECTSLKNIDVSNWDVSNVTVMKNMFSSCNSLTTIDVSNWDVSKVTDMEQMFFGCTSLTTLDVSNWDVGKVATTKQMFDCGTDFGDIPMTISKLDVSRWNPASCTNMSFMFYGCRGPKEIDVSNWDVSKVTTFDHMFAHSYLKVNGTRNWKTTSATNMNALFHSVSNTVIDVTNFDTKNVQFFSQMFQSAGQLTKIIGLEKFNTSNGLGFDEMFQSCPNLRELNLSSFDTRKAKDGVAASTNGHTTKTLQNFFQNNYRLEKITIGENFSFVGDGTTTNTANHAALHAPSADYISNADGKWYTQKRVSYTPAEVKTKGAETYYASLGLANNIDFLIKNKTLMDVADALRTKTLGNAVYTPTQMADVISSMDDIGVNITFENYSVTDDGNGNITISKGE